MSNLGSYVKAIRKAPTHLTEELKNDFSSRKQIGKNGFKAE